MEYAETAVLVDVMNVDIDAARARLAEFLPNELNEFEAQVDTLADMIAAEIRRRAVSR